MKRIFFILWFCVCGLVTIAAAPAADDRQLCDSIFTVYQNMPEDTTRTHFIREMIHRYIGKEWVKEWLDSALTFARRTNDHKGEVGLRYEFFYYYAYHLDLEGMEEAFVPLKEIAFRYEIFDDYYLAWHYILQLKAARGDSENAFIEARKMREEALRLQVSRGVFLSYVSDGRTYGFARKIPESVDAYLHALGLPDVSLDDKIMVHRYLCMTYYAIDQLDKVLEDLRVQRELVGEIIRKTPEKIESLQDVLLGIELEYCNIYSKDDSRIAKLKEHLDEARKYYRDDCFSSYFIKYHMAWAEYNWLMKDTDGYFREMEISISSFTDAQPMYENVIRRLLGKRYQEAGRLEEAARLFRMIVLKTDSVNKMMLRMNEEAIQTNYKIRKSLFDKELKEKLFWQIAAVGSLLCFLLLVYGVIHLYRMRRALKKSEEEMRESYAIVASADKMKESFLRNIVYEIRLPLNAVVGFSDYLCSEKDLPPEVQQEYSGIVKHNAEKLIELIFNVLDLSRLESGMMKFNVQEQDAVQLCKEAGMMVGMREDRPVIPEFHTDLEVLPIRVDVARFMKLMVSVLSVPKDAEEWQPVKYSLLREGNEAKITVVNSPILWNSGEKKPFQLQHDINRLYLATFGGTYQCLEEGDNPMIIITYPIN